MHLIQPWAHSAPHHSDLKGLKKLELRFQFRSNFLLKILQVKFQHKTNMQQLQDLPLTWFLIRTGLKGDYEGYNPGIPQ